jgi:hypothetical protein
MDGLTVSVLATALKSEKKQSVRAKLKKETSSVSDIALFSTSKA